MTDEHKEETPTNGPFLEWIRAEAIKAGASPEVLLLIDKAGVFVQGCQDVRDAAQNDVVVANDERDAAQAALVHATNRLAESDSLVGELRQHVLRRVVVSDPTGAQVIYKNGAPVDDMEDWPDPDELNQLVKAHRIACTDNAAWQGRYDRFVIAVREYREKVGFPDGAVLPQGFREAMGLP